LDMKDFQLHSEGWSSAYEYKERFYANIGL